MLEWSSDCSSTIEQDMPVQIAEPGRQPSPYAPPLGERMRPSQPTPTPQFPFTPGSPVGVNPGVPSTGHMPSTGSNPFMPSPVTPAPGGSVPGRAGPNPYVPPMNPVYSPAPVGPQPMPVNPAPAPPMQLPANPGAPVTSMPWSTLAPQLPWEHFMPMLQHFVAYHRGGR